MVLIADDDLVIRSLVEKKLVKAAYRVITASDGEQALELARSMRPDVVVLDWMMPGLGGPEVCRLLKESADTSGIPILLLTSRAHEEDIRTGFEFGADDYLTKPFDTSELDEAVRRLLPRE